MVLKRLFRGVLFCIAAIHFSDLNAADAEFRITQAGHKGQLELKGLVEGLRQQLEIKLINATESKFLNLQVSSTCSCVRADADAFDLEAGSEILLKIEIDPPRTELDQRVSVRAATSSGAPVDVVTIQFKGKTKPPIALSSKFIYVPEEGADLIVEVASKEFSICNLDSIGLNDERLELSVIAANEDLGRKGGCKLKVEWESPEFAPSQDFTVSLQGHFSFQEQEPVAFEENFVVVFKPRIELSPRVVRFRRRKVDADFNTLSATVLMRDFGTPDTELNMMLVAKIDEEPKLLDPDILHNYDKVSSRIGSSSVNKISLIARLVPSAAGNKEDIYVVAYKRGREVSFDMSWQEFVASNDVFKVEID
ncbi:MAG: hypothetical protein ACE361_22735 [Aureliella sp.]